MAEGSGTDAACSCCGRNLVLLTCSGASNVGHLSDLAARELVRRGVARMGCLAGVAARAPGTLNALQQATWIVVLDGCAVQCGQRTVEGAGYKNVLFLRADALGMKRGETPVNDENVRRLADSVCQQIGESIGTAVSDSSSPCCG